ncbi:MAG: hypothetical protein H2056_01500 [Sphingopyxis sp.]|nr:hypothetical protein [Sphingopyxis sp.]
MAGNDDAQQRHSAEMQAKKDEGICNRAFDFLQDEAVNPRLEKDDAFYKSQREIAERCSGKGKSQ